MPSKLPDRTRRIAEALLRDGRLTAAEIAQKLRVSPAIIGHWKRELEIDWEAAHEARVDRVFREFQQRYEEVC